MVLGLLLVLTSICIFVFLFKSSGPKDALFNKLRGPPSFPFLGIAIELNIPTEEFFQYFLDLHKRFGERVVAYMLGIYFVVLSSPSDIEKLLTSTANINKGKSYKLAKPWLCDSLLVSRGEKWHHRRKMLSSAFHFKVLEEFMGVFNEQANVLVDILRQDFSDGNERDICPYLGRCALDIIGETAMGIKFDAQHHNATAYLAAVDLAVHAGMYRVFRPYFWSDFVFSWTPYGRKHTTAIKTLHDFTYRTIQEHKAAEKPMVKQLLRADSSIFLGKKRRLAILDLLLEAQKNPENNLTDLDIREEVDVFMFGGHDTSASSLSWTIFLLGCHPEYQIQLHYELDTIFGDDRTRPVITEDLAEMKYMEMCIKESLRLFPIGALFTRLLTTDLVLDNEIQIPAGYDVVVNVMAVHRSESNYPNPSEYQPDRFLPENIKSHHPYAFLPFSAGPRNCIGQKFAMMEMKVVLANLFRNFRFEAVDRLEDVVPMLEGVTKPRDGLTVRIVPRQ